MWNHWRLILFPTLNKLPRLRNEKERKTDEKWHGETKMLITANWRVRAKSDVSFESRLWVTNFLSRWKKAKCCISPLTFSQFPVRVTFVWWPRQSDSSAQCHRLLCVQLIPQWLRPRPATDFHHRGSRAKGASFELACYCCDVGERWSCQQQSARGQVGSLLQRRPLDCVPAHDKKIRDPNCIPHLPLTAGPSRYTALNHYLTQDKTRLSCSVPGNRFIAE